MNEFPDLPRVIQNELADPRFSNRTHGKRSTYTAGCHGPLCRKAERDAKNRAYRRAKGDTPVLQYTARPAREFDDVIERAQELHEAERAS